jgi:hypothetical protein
MPATWNTSFRPMPAASSRGLDEGPSEEQRKQRAAKEMRSFLKKRTKKLLPVTGRAQAIIKVLCFFLSRKKILLFRRKEARDFSSCWTGAAAWFPAE